MKQYQRTVLSFINLFAWLIVIAVLGGCTTTRKTTQTLRTDTLYIEQVVEKERLVCDTIEIISTIVEYLPDTSGAWKPIKMVVENSLQRASQKSKEEEIISDEIIYKSEENVNLKINEPSKGIGFLILFFVALIIIITIVKLCK